MSPEVAASQIAAQHDSQWIRCLVIRLEQTLRTTPLQRLIALWGLSAAEVADIFGVSRQAFSKWLEQGPPADRAPAIASLAAATDTLERHVERERIAAVVRRPADMLGGKSLLDLTRERDYARVQSMVAMMFDLRRVQP